MTEDTAENREFTKPLKIEVKSFWLIVVGEEDPLHPTGLSPSEQERCENHPAIHQAGHCDDVALWLKRTDVLLAPSEREGMPVGVMEALCMGGRSSVEMSAAPVN